MAGERLNGPDVGTPQSGLPALMRAGDLPATPDAGAAALPPRPSTPAPVPARASRRLLQSLLLVDLLLLAVVIVWPWGAPPNPPRRITPFAVDQSLVEQAIAQAGAGHFDAAITDLEQHLARHADLAPVERQLVLRAAAIFAARAGRAGDVARFEAGLDPAVRARTDARLAAAEAAERAGDLPRLRRELAELAGDPDAPPSALTRVAEILLRAGDGTPLDRTDADAATGR